MQTMFVGPEHVHSLAFAPTPGDHPLADAQAAHQENPPLIKQGGGQPFNRLFYFTMKRLLDLTLTTLALGLLWPVMLVIAVAIKIDSPGPIFVAQERVGVRRRRSHGQMDWQQIRFPLYKFRTTVAMTAHPQQAKRGVAQQTVPLAGPTALQPIKIEAKTAVMANRAVTTIGRFLRQTSLDQLPQLWNILKGDLSLVGPRPALPAELKHYTPSHLRRLATMPGMTGLWQLCDLRSAQYHYQAKAAHKHPKALSFEQMVQLDLEYIEKQSLGLDVRILGNTFLAVLRSPAKAE